MDDEYDTSKVVKMSSPNPMFKWLLRAALIYTLPKYIWTSLMLRKDKNPLHDGVRELSGDKVTALESKVFNFDEVKEASRSLSITINDLMTSALSMAVKRYFQAKGGPSADAQAINIAVPVSMRWSGYETFE
jgi:hypothetical protein